MTDKSLTQVIFKKLEDNETLTDEETVKLIRMIKNSLQLFRLLGRKLLVMIKHWVTWVVIFLTTGSTALMNYEQLIRWIE